MAVVLSYYYVILNVTVRGRWILGSDGSCPPSTRFLFFVSLIDEPSSIFSCNPTCKNLSCTTNHLSQELELQNELSDPVVLIYSDVLNLGG